MATRLETFNRPRKLSASEVPWDEWIEEGAIWKLTEGVDFTTKAKSFQAQISKKAKARGFKAEQYIETEGEITHIIFRIVKPPAPQKIPGAKGSIFDA